MTREKKNFLDGVKGTALMAAGGGILGGAFAAAVGIGAGILDGSQDIGATVNVTMDAFGFAMGGCGAGKIILDTVKNNPGYKAGVFLTGIFSLAAGIAIAAEIPDKPVAKFVSHHLVAAGFKHEDRSVVSKAAQRIHKDKAKSAVVIRAME